MRSPDERIEVLCEEITSTIRDGYRVEGCVCSALAEAKLRVQLGEFARAIIEVAVRDALEPGNR